MEKFLTLRTVRLFSKAWPWIQQKTTLFILTLLLACTTATRAQSPSEGRFSLAVYAGSGFLIGPSNLSPHGIDHRQAYKHGLTTDIRAYYDAKHVGLVGMKFNFFSASGNYQLNGQIPVAEDINLFYIAPQWGDRCRMNNRLQAEYVLGVGYLNYRNEGVTGGIERQYTRGIFAANIDLALYYDLGRNFHIGLSASFLGGKSSSLKEKTDGKTATVKLEKWDQIKVNRADLTLSILRIF